MYWGKSLVVLALTALLAGCSAPAPDKALPTSSPKPTAPVVVKTGDVEADKLIAALQASCALAKSKGMSGYWAEKKSTVYAYPAYFVNGRWPWNAVIKTRKGYEIGGWISGDPVCNEAIYAQMVMPKGSKPNKDGMVFNFRIKKVGADTYDWSLNRTAPVLSTFRITLSNGLVTGIKYSGSGTDTFSYGPFSKEIDVAYKKALVASNQQYLPLAEPVWGMTFKDAKAYLKKHGLKILLAFEDDTDYYPSGLPNGISDPKRILVNIIKGKIVGLWTL